MKAWLGDGFIIEFLQSHTNVVHQPSFDSSHYSGLNPYALGFAMMSDIRRICENPTDEDKHWFPDIAGSDWLKTMNFAMQNFKDESFISQYLSPKVIRDFKLFSILDDDREMEVEVTSIHNEVNYQYIRQSLSEQYNLGSIEPNIQVYNVDRSGDRSLTLRHNQYSRMPLDKSTNEVMKHVRRLWGFDVYLETVAKSGSVVQTFECEL